MKLSKLKLMCLILPAFLLVGCGDDDDVKQVQAPVAQQEQQVQQQQPQVVYVQPEQPQQPQVIYEQAPQQAPVIVNQPSSGIGLDHIAAGAVGYVMGRNSGNSSSYGRNHTVVNKTIVNKTYVNQKPTKVYSGSKSSYYDSVPKRNSSSFNAVRSYKSKPVKSYRSTRKH